jgi:hypothetical protein
MGLNLFRLLLIYFMLIFFFLSHWKILILKKKKKKDFSPGLKCPNNTLLLFSCNGWVFRLPELWESEYWRQQNRIIKSVVIQTSRLETGRRPFTWRYSHLSTYVYLFFGLVNLGFFLTVLRFSGENSQKIYIKN